MALPPMGASNMPRVKPSALREPWPGVVAQLIFPFEKEETGISRRRRNRENVVAVPIFLALLEARQQGPMTGADA